MSSKERALSQRKHQNHVGGHRTVKASSHVHSATNLSKELFLMTPIKSWSPQRGLVSKCLEEDLGVFFPTHLLLWTHKQAVFKVLTENTWKLSLGWGGQSLATLLGVTDGCIYTFSPWKIQDVVLSHRDYLSEK